MLLSRHTVIAPKKMWGYLLTFGEEADKSGFLALLGYTENDAERLAADIRQQLLPCDASPAGETAYGRKFVIEGRLRGPNGRSLPVKSIWMMEKATGRTKFITLYSAQ